MEIEEQEFNQGEKTKNFLTLKEPANFKRYATNIRALTDRIVSFFNTQEAFEQETRSENDMYVMKQTGQMSSSYRSTINNLNKHFLFNTESMPKATIAAQCKLFDVELPSYMTTSDKKVQAKNRADTEKIDVKYFFANFDFIIKSADDVIASCGSKNIKAIDLNRLKPNEWLSGDVINFYSGLLQTNEFYQSIQRYYKNCIPNTDYIIIGTYFSSFNWFIEDLVKKISPNQQQDKSEEPIQNYKDDLVASVGNIFIHKVSFIFKRKYFDISKYNIIFIPFHYRGEHWKLYAVKGFKKYYDYMANLINEDLDSFLNRNFETNKVEELITVVSIDSLNSQANNTQNKYIMYYTVNFLLTGLLNTDFHIKIPLNKLLITQDNFYYYNVDVPVQNNGYDCGVAVLENIEQSIMHGDKFLDKCNPNKVKFYDFEGVNWKREKMIEIIVSLAKKETLWVS